MKNIILLGASGSIGTQSLEVIEAYPNLFKLVALSVGSFDQNLELLIDKFDLQSVALFSERRIVELEAKYPNVKFYLASNISEMIDDIEADLVINAIVGIAGLKPTISAIENKMDIALANKETLVTGGDLIMNLAKDHNVNIYPVDSEHSAIWQTIIGNDKKDIHSITLTASGGSFRDLTREDLKSVTKADALNHPNWSMGSKITIDSATMMNKGLEIIEAHYLFNLDYDQINVIINHQSTIHSFTQYADYSIIAQMGTADMKVPIQFALTYPNHLPIKDAKPLDLVALKNISFQEVDFKRFPLVKLAYEVGRLKGNKPIVMNAANEVAVALFLDDKISFLDIETIVVNVVEQFEFTNINSFNEIFEVNSQTKQFVLENYKNIVSR